VSAVQRLRSRLGRGGRPDHTQLSYAEQTHGSPYWIVRYAHQQRAVVAVDMMLAGDPKVIIDWGTGDGLVIERLLEQAADSLELVIAFEPGVEMSRLLRKRMDELPLGDRVEVCTTVEEAERALAGRRIDVFACLGVLEHLPWSSRATYYDFARAHLADDGCLLIDVPIELGPALLVKELARHYLKGRPLGYGRKELLRRAEGRTERDPRRFEPDASSDFIYSHDHFDHRHLIAEVAVDYEVVERRNTPVGWAPSWAFNQEVIFRARPARASRP
jgi:hypothetical protein